MNTAVTMRQDQHLESNANTVPGLRRTVDVIQGQEDLEHLFSLKNFPVFLGCTTAPASSDQVFDLSFAIGRHSGCVQLDQLVPLDLLYAENHAPVVGALWEQHHREFAAFVAECRPSSVLEIGGAHGMLCKNYQQAHPQTRWTIVEPNPIPVEGLHARFIRGFFDSSFQADEHYDTVVHSHTLEHIYEPRQFIGDIAKLAQPGDHHCFAVPDLAAWFERKYTNALNFEHTYLLTDDYISGMLAEHGFKVLRKQAFGDRHSVFYATVKATPDAAMRQIYPAELYTRHKAMALDYQRYLLDEVAKINAAVQQAPGRVFLFGAHVFSQTLINQGLDTRRVECLLDNAKLKQGQRLYGTPLTVQDPSVLRGLDSPTVIIRAGAYEAEIKVGILRDHNPGTVFV